MTCLLSDLMPTLRRLLPPGTKVLVGTSGGPDSQVLLDLLARAQHELQLARLEAAGVDHGLRRAARAELALAAELAAAHSLPYSRLGVQVPSSGNLLQNARQVRYSALEAHAAASGASCIAVAHTATDQVETMLQRLARGCGLGGAAAMQAERAGLVRPLLGVSRKQVLAYAQLRGLRCAHDPSNRNLATTRARLRELVLPQLEQLNPRFEEAFGRFARRALADEVYLSEQAQKLLQEAVAPGGEDENAGLDLLTLAAGPKSLRGRALRLWLAQAGLVQPPAAFLKAVMRQRSASFCQLEHGRARFTVSHGCLRPTAAPQPAWPPLALHYPADLTFSGWPLTLHARSQAVKREELSQFDTLGGESVALDADRLHFGLSVRPWRTGDKLRPFGLNGHVKVGDLFTNAKVPRALRAKWPIVTHGERVIWVAGLRRASDAPLRATTRRIISLKVGPRE